jgi:hypothetical protein
VTFGLHAGNVNAPLNGGCLLTDLYSTLVAANAHCSTIIPNEPSYLKMAFRLTVRCHAGPADRRTFMQYWRTIMT